MTQHHLFFDLDRTLWDFESNSEIALKLLFDELKLHESIDNFHAFHKRYKKNNAELWKLYGEGKMSKELLRSERFRKTLSTFDIHDPGIIEHMSNGYVEISPKQTSLFPQTIETLEDLTKEGYRMSLITNGFREVQETKIQNSGLARFFEHMICSEDVGKNKPHPDIFQHAMQLTGSAPSGSVMIGDDYQIDILGAQRAGMHAVHFDPECQYSRRKEQWRITSLTELPGLLPWILRTIS